MRKGSLTTVHDDQHPTLVGRLDDGATALAWSGHWDDLESAQMLIRAGVNVNSANDYGATPLWEACNNGSAAMVDKC